MDKNLELILDEYKMGRQVSDGYFRNLYSIISFTLVLYGAMITMVSTKGDMLDSDLIFFFFLPIATYILGLFYTYNSYVITKLSYYFIRLEMLIKLRYYETENEECLYNGWDNFAKKTAVDIL